jgi:hypothetical protein
MNQIIIWFAKVQQILKICKKKTKKVVYIEKIYYLCTEIVRIQEKRFCYEKDLSFPSALVGAYELR